MEIGKLLSSSRDRLINRLKKFAYRHAWVESHVTNGIAFQLRAMRKAKHWDQRKLAKAVFSNSELQSMISRYENPDYGKYSLRTLLDFAKVFDVGLIVRFAPFSELVNWEGDLFDSNLAVPSFDSELAANKFSIPSTTSFCRVLIADTAGTLKGFKQFYRPQNLIKPGNLVQKQIMPEPPLKASQVPGGAYVQ